VIGAAYFGLAGSHDVRIAVIICLALLIAALSHLALVLRGQKPSALKDRAPAGPANDMQGNALASTAMTALARGRDTRCSSPLATRVAGRVGPRRRRQAPPVAGRLRLWRRPTSARALGD
jgi:hypothetical protein